MKKILLTLALILCIVGISNAQMKQITVVDPDGNSSFYPGIGEALGAAPENSSIIIPGGEYYWGFEITKPVHIYGVGHYPGSSADGPEGKTKLVGYAVVFGTGSDGSSITGVDAEYFQTNGSVHNISIFRCKATGFSLYHWDDGNVTIRECVITGHIRGNGLGNKYSIIEKNVCYSIWGFNYSLIAHNVILDNDETFGGDGINGISNSLIINNIIADDDNETLYSTVSCNIINNLSNSLSNEWSASSNTYSGNIWEEDINDIFISANPLNGFNYDDDYHLKTDCPGIGYAAAYGENPAGKDLGIYGTIYPYKEEGMQPALPVIPNITNAVISTQLNEAGMIEVEVSAQAQTK